MHLAIEILLVFGSLSGVFAADCTNPATPCQNRGTCDPISKTCTCMPCNVGDLCESNYMGLINKPCPCFNGGTCKCHLFYPAPLYLPTAKIVCVCPYGTYGDRCQYPAPTVPPTSSTCTPICTTGVCKNFGIYDPVTKICKCLPYFNGPCCDYAYIGHPCVSYPCQNGGVCSIEWIYPHYRYKCTCQTGFSGECCQISGGTTGCAANPCQNSGSCVELTATSYECLCPCFHGGTHCEQAIAPLYFLDPCSAEPCMNGGTCYCYGHSYICTCRLGFSGDRCQYGFCVAGTCDNSRPCKEPLPSLDCDCGSYTGRYCQYEAGAKCYPNPCQNGGTCVAVGTTDYSCKCTCQSMGKSCEFAGMHLPLASPCAAAPPGCASGQKCVCEGTQPVCV